MISSRHEMVKRGPREDRFDRQIDRRDPYRRSLPDARGRDEASARRFYATADIERLEARGARGSIVYPEIPLILISAHLNIVLARASLCVELSLSLSI